MIERVRRPRGSLRLVRIDVITNFPDLVRGPIGLANQTSDRQLSEMLPSRSRA